MATDANNNDQANNDQQKATFDEAQQAKVNYLIREAQGREARELRSELETTKATLTALQSDLNSAKTDLSKAKTPAAKKEAAADVEALQNQINEMKSAGANTQQEVDRL